MDENSKAIAKNLSQAVADVTDIVHKLFGPLADEFGQMMGDKVYEYRVRNFVSVMKRVKKLLADNHVAPNLVPPRLLLSIAEAASVEEDETLQQKWAGLLATASVQPDMSPSFAEVLKQLSPVEARILDSMCDEVRKEGEAVHKVNVFEVPRFNEARVPTPDGDAVWIKEARLGPSIRVAGKMPIGGIRAQLILRNFERLGLLSLSYETPRNEKWYTQNRPPRIDEIVIFTRFAEEFVGACQGPKPDAGSPHGQ